MKNERLHRMSWLALLGALAFALMFLIQLPIPPFPAFLKYDPGDIPAMIATYSLGTGAGAAVQVIKSVLFLISGRSQEGWIGVLGNFIPGVALVVATGAVQRGLQRAGVKSWGWEILSAAAGAVGMAALAIPVLATTVYPLWGMKGAAAWHAALYISTPFNLFKGFLSSVLSVAFYRRVRPYLVGRTAARKAA